MKNVDLHTSEKSNGKNGHCSVGKSPLKEQLLNGASNGKDVASNHQSKARSSVAKKLSKFALDAEPSSVESDNVVNGNGCHAVEIKVS